MQGVSGTPRKQASFYEKQVTKHFYSFSMEMKLFFEIIPQNLTLASTYKMEPSEPHPMLVSPSTLPQ